MKIIIETCESVLGIVECALNFFVARVQYNNDDLFSRKLRLEKLSL